MRLRGPQPKCKWQKAGHFAFSSGANLIEGIKQIGRGSGRKEEEESTSLGQITRSEFWVVMHEVDGDLDCCSLRDGPSIDLNGLLSKTCDTTMSK